MVLGLEKPLVVGYLDPLCLLNHGLLASIYTIAVFESRNGGSTFWILPRVWEFPGHAAQAVVAATAERLTASRSRAESAKDAEGGGCSSRPIVTCGAADKELKLRYHNIDRLMWERSDSKGPSVYRART